VHLDRSVTLGLHDVKHADAFFTYSKILVLSRKTLSAVFLLRNADFWPNPAGFGCTGGADGKVVEREEEAAKMALTSNVGKAEPRSENQRVLMKVLDEHDVAVHLIHLGIEDPTAIRGDRKTPIEILV
jgi:hypothetical protein